MEQKENDRDSRSDFAIKLQFTDIPGTIHYCSTCNKFKIYQDIHISEKCDVCGSDRKIIDENSYSELIVMLLASVVSKYVESVSKRGDNFIVKLLLKGDIKNILSTISGYSKFKLGISIPKPNGFNRIKKELNALVSLSYNWMTFDILVTTLWARITYSFTNLGRWNMSITVSPLEDK